MERSLSDCAIGPAGMLIDRDSAWTAEGRRKALVAVRLQAHSAAHPLDLKRENLGE